jgi:hypothetical protein
MAGIAKSRLKEERRAWRKDHPLVRVLIKYPEFWHLFGFLASLWFAPLCHGLGAILPDAWCSTHGKFQTLCVWYGELPYFIKNCWIPDACSSLYRSCPPDGSVRTHQQPDTILLVELACMCACSSSLVRYYSSWMVLGPKKKKLLRMPCQIFLIAASHKTLPCKWGWTQGTDHRYRCTSVSGVPPLHEVESVWRFTDFSFFWQGFFARLDTFPDGAQNIMRWSLLKKLSIWLVASRCISYSVCHDERYGIESFSHAGGNVVSLARRVARGRMVSCDSTCVTT